MNVPAYDLSKDPYFTADATGHLTASFGGEDLLHVEPHDGGFECHLSSPDFPRNNGIFAVYRTDDPREVLALAVSLDNTFHAEAGSNFDDPEDAPFTGFSHEHTHIHNPFADEQYGDWKFSAGNRLDDPRNTYGAAYEGWLEALKTARESQVAEHGTSWAEREEQRKAAGKGRVL